VNFSRANGTIIFNQGAKNLAAFLWLELNNTTIALSRVFFFHIKLCGRKREPVDIALKIAQPWFKCYCTVRSKNSLPKIKGIVQINIGVGHNSC